VLVALQLIVELLKLNIAAGRGQFQVSVTGRLTPRINKSDVVT